MHEVNLQDLEFEFSLKPSDAPEFSHFLVDFKGKAIAWTDDAEEKVVAKLVGHRLDLATARKSYSNIQDLFDSISAEISDLGTHIILDNNCYIECCSSDEAQKTPCSSLVYIDELVVDPQYRNQEIGTEMLRRMSEIVDMNNTLVALKAYPIVDEKTEKRTPELTNKLKHFYRKLGFRHSGEHYMVKDARGCHAQRVRALQEQDIHQREYPRLASQ